MSQDDKSKEPKAEMTEADWAALADEQIYTENLSGRVLAVGEVRMPHREAGGGTSWTTRAEREETTQNITPRRP